MIPEGEDLRLYPGRAAIGYRKWAIGHVGQDQSLRENRAFFCGINWNQVHRRDIERESRGIIG
jgi:hypothetical protein